LVELFETYDDARTYDRQTGHILVHSCNKILISVSKRESPHQTSLATATWTASYVIHNSKTSVLLLWW